MDEEYRTVKSRSGEGRKGWEIRERDEEIVRWLGRHRLATAEQVMRRFGMHRAKAYARLGVLVESGLVRYEAGIRSKRVYLATRAGLTQTGLRLTPATVSPSSFAHDLAAVDVAIELERDFEGLVLSERELRASDRSAEYQLLEPATGAVMWPDLVVDHLERYAVEVELTLKAKDRLRAKMLAYSASDYAKVTYRVEERAVAFAVLDAGKRAGLGKRLQIEPLRPLAKQSADQEAPSPRISIELATEARRLRDELAIARAEVAKRGELIQRQQDYVTLITNEVLAYLDAGRQQRQEIIRRWEHEFSRYRGGQ